VIACILGGMDWAIEHEAKIVSMSLGIRGWTPDFLDLLGILRSAGILPVIAVGNEGPGTSRSPGNHPKVISVGAHDGQFEVADFSSSQRFTRKIERLEPDVVAPGVAVRPANNLATCT